MLRKGEVIFAGPINELLARHKASIIAKPSSVNSLHYLSDILKDAGFDSTIEDDHLLISADESAAIRINKIAFEGGIVLAQLTPIKASLEETFFELTGGAA
jgi:ABC-2 type transport system ATP-binding protein